MLSGQMLAGQLALISASLFAGAALYVSAVEHPARRALDDRAMLVQWRPAYARGYAMQAPLAILGCLAGGAAFVQSGGWLWAAGALMMIANWPYTLLVVMPVNRALKALDPTNPGASARPLMERWARLHAVRTALGFTATLDFLIASLGR